MKKWEAKWKLRLGMQPSHSHSVTASCFSVWVVRREGIAVVLIRLGIRHLDMKAALLDLFTGLCPAVFCQLLVNVMKSSFKRKALVAQIYQLVFGLFSCLAHWKDACV